MTISEASKPMTLPIWRTRANKRQVRSAFQFDSVPSVSHPSLTFNPLTYNAPVSGAGVRSTEASAPLAG